MTAPSARYQPRALERGGRHYLGAKLPADLVPILGRREIKRSLGTSDAKRALTLVQQDSAKDDTLFSGLGRW